MSTETPKQMKRRLRANKKANGLTNGQIRYIILTIFPSRDDSLDAYFNNVLGYFTSAVQTRLHVDSVKWGVFTGLMGGPRLPTGTPPNTNSTPGTWNYVFPLEKSSATRTTPLVVSKDELIVSIKAALRNVYSDIPDSALTPTDTTVTHIVPKSQHADRGPEPEEITILVTIKLDSLGGGKEEVLFLMPNGDIAMPFLNANVEYSYSLIPMNAVPPVPVPATSAQCDFKDVSSTARLILNLGEAAVGMKIVMFARYVYIKHPTKSGGYGAGVPDIIS
jgi:hypothetical protein